MLSQLKKIKDHQRSYGHIYCDSLIQIVSDLWTDKRRDGFWPVQIKTSSLHAKTINEQL